MGNPVNFFEQVGGEEGIEVEELRLVGPVQADVALAEAALAQLAEVLRHQRADEEQPHRPLVPALEHALAEQPLAVRRQRLVERGGARGGLGGEPRVEVRPDLQRPDPQQLDDQQDELERERLRAEAGEAGETVHALPEWLARTTLALRSAQSFPVPNLPAGSDLRIALVLDEARFEAPQVFRLRPDETTRVEITLPGAAPLAGEGSEVLPLAMRVRVVPLPPEAPRPGFTWR